MRGRYVGETSRSLLERNREHREDQVSSSDNIRSHRRDHIMTMHPEEDPMNQDLFTIKILKRHKTALTRMIHESILVRKGEGILLNAKEEYSRTLLPCLRVESNRRSVQPAPHPALHQVAVGSQTHRRSSDQTSMRPAKRRRQDQDNQQVEDGTGRDVQAEVIDGQDNLQDKHQQGEVVQAETQDTQEEEGQGRDQDTPQGGEVLAEVLCDQKNLQDTQEEGPGRDQDTPRGGEVQAEVLGQKVQLSDPLQAQQVPEYDHIQGVRDEVFGNVNDGSEQITSENPIIIDRHMKSREKMRIAEDRQHMKFREKMRIAEDGQHIQHCSKVLSLKPPPPMKVKKKKTRSKSLKVTHKSQSENILRYFTHTKGVLEKVRDGDGPINHSNILITGEQLKRETIQLSQPPTGPGQDDSEDCDLP